MCTCVHMCTRVVMCARTNVQWSLISIIQDLVKNNILTSDVCRWQQSGRGHQLTSREEGQIVLLSNKISQCKMSLVWIFTHLTLWSHTQLLLVSHFTLDHQDFKLNYLLAFYCSWSTRFHSVHWVSLDLNLTLHCLLDQIHCIVLLHRTRNIPSSK